MNSNTETLRKVHAYGRRASNGDRYMDEVEATISRTKVFKDATAAGHSLSTILDAFEDGWAGYPFSA